MSKSGAYGNYIQTIEAVGGGVQFGFLDDDRMVNFGVKILRVSGVTTAKRNSVNFFMRQQVGKDYWLNTLRLNTDINSNSWYCSEIVYAAYKYNQDANGYYIPPIDIGVKKNSSGGDVYLSLGCMPADIYNSYNTYQIMSSESSAFVGLGIVSKASGKWTIRVYNYSNSSKTVYYNTKMCFKADAQSWNLSGDVSSKTVGANSSSTFVVSENWFADYVAFSVRNGNYRLITYAKDLNTNGYMTIERQKINW